MAAIAQDTDLPTTKRLGITTKDVTSADADKVATEWLKKFEEKITHNDVDGILSLLTEDAWWRDLLVMTWDLRSFQGPQNIKKFLEDRLAQSKLKNFKLHFAQIDDLYEDLAWVRVHFTCENNVGTCSGVARLVPVKGEWKAHNVFTNLETLNGHPDATGPRRNFAPNHGKWLEQRQREKEFLDKDPEVLVVGGGQSGLEIAARLKLLGVPTLVCEKHKRIGDNWRHRYAALCLHDVVCESSILSFFRQPDSAS
jgi:ketosteroid isomerase-like protein